MGLRIKIVGLLWLLPSLIFGINLRSELPTVKIYEIRTTTSTKLEIAETEHIVDKLPNTNIIVGEDIQPNSKLIFECDAKYPVQWQYSGDGMPEYNTNTTQSQNQGGITRPDIWFSASLSLGFRRHISSHDSGKYTCRSLQNPQLAVFYDLYVASDKLFINPEGETIYYKQTDDFVRVPCSVSNPKAAVSLQKSINGLVQCPLNESITYDSSKGFNLKVSNQFDPAGTYLCTAGFNNTYQVVRYTVIRDFDQTSSSFTKDTCTKNSDCLLSQACIQSRTGYTCTSPCGSVCGRNTQCDVINHTPRCYCLKDHSGDPYSACYPDAVPSKPENIMAAIDPCIPTPCGQNTVCERLGSVARCRCANGFHGDPYSRCHYYQQQQQQQQARDPCYPNPCGPNSVCNHRNGFTSCSCRVGYYGQPPYCRAECEINSHCPNDRACVQGRCRNPCEGACTSFRRTECRVINRQPVCATINCAPGYYGRDCLSIYTKEDGQIKVPNRLGEAFTSNKAQEQTTPCSPFPCGTGAECTVKTVDNKMLNVTNDIALCQCPPNLTGNADVECYPIEEHVQTDALTTTTTVATENKALNNTLDKCNPECGINANCTRNSCICPQNFQGNSYIKCYPIFCKTVEDCDNVNAACTVGKCVEEGTVTSSISSSSLDDMKQCGINAINAIADGKSNCLCPDNFTGDASVSCHPIINDTHDTTQEKFSSEACDQCGRNTVCVNETICECIKSFKGNPLIGCELDCSNNDDCPAEQLCHQESKKCVSPCDVDYQTFFVQCGRNAACKVENHTAFCYCPPNFPHGSPNTHCKEEKWMPTHKMPNGTCVDEKRLKCGPNSVCKRFHDLERCICIPGYFGNAAGEQGCKIGLQECRKHSQCGNEEECVNGRCLNACRHRNTCGPLSGCKADNHSAKCICHIGTILNPKGECEAATGALAQRLLFFRSFEDQ